MSLMSTVRVRFAPSPTGFLHIGGLRTALFNYLFARREGGSFILRIEDTDRTRFVEGALEDIKRGLAWCGIEWDEGPDTGGAYGPYVQSERLDLYRDAAEELLNKGAAYRCFCTAERLAEIRESGQSGYDRKCRELSPDESEQRAAAGEPCVVRLKAPLDGETVFQDHLRGEVRFENSTIGDIVILKTDFFPTYHLASVVDDHKMEISHVLRGEEWISSTPKHILLYNAFEWEPPAFVHLPVILSPKGGKLSKRDGATSVKDFITKGYLPEAMVNFLALLGWSLDGETSMITMDELKGVFTIDKIGMASPVFDITKLDDLNGKYIRSLDPEALLAAVLPVLEESGLLSPADDGQVDYLRSILPLVVERLNWIPEVLEKTAFFFREDLDYGDGSLLIPKKTTAQEAASILEEAGKRLGAVDDFSEENIEAALRAQVGESGMKVGQVFMAIRIAVSGSKTSPGLFETIHVLGEERTLKRLASAGKILQGMV